MPSRRKHKHRFHGLLDSEDVYAKLNEMRSKEVNRIKTTLVTMEQRYAHYIASVLDVKKRVSYQLFGNMLDQVIDLCNKQTTIMNSYYQNELQQLQKEKQDLIHTNQKHQKLIQHYQTQELARKKQRRFQMNQFNPMNQIKPNSPSNAFVVSSDQDIHTHNHNDMASSIDMLRLNSQSVTPSLATNLNLNDSLNDHLNLFNAMPKFQMEPTPVHAPTISSLTCSHTVPTVDGAHSDSSHGSSSTIYDGDTKKGIKKEPAKKRKRKKKRKKKKTFKYKYHKRTDKYVFAPAKARPGDVDKTWLWCNHDKCNGDGVCGVNFIRTLKDREDQAQHYCDGDEQQKLITRKFGSVFGKCAYCHGEKACTRLATIEEIEAYQKKCKDMNVVPNTYGGYKLIGARQTKAAYTRANPRTRGGGGVKGRPKKKRKKTHHGDKTKRKRAVSAGFESMLPRLNDSNDTGGAKSDDAGGGGDGRRRTIWEDEGGDGDDDADEDNDDGTTVSDINTDNVQNKPLKRRSRKRKRSEFEDDNDSYDSSDFERDVKTQKIDRSELMALDLDELLSKAFQWDIADLAWDVENRWCRYCGARGSAAFLPSPWGDHMLCAKHGNAWKENKLDLSNIVEPLTSEHAINKEDCTERMYLIDLIVKYQKEQPLMMTYHPMDGRRRSLRNLKKEMAKKVVDVSSSESEEEDASDVDSSGEEDEDEPIAMRMNRANTEREHSPNGHTHESNNVYNSGNDDDVRIIEKDKEQNIENVIINVDDGSNLLVTEYINNNDAMQDEDDDILGVD